MPATVPDARCRQRAATFAQRVYPLPGALPYVNRRPMSVRGVHDGLTVREFLACRHPHVAAADWVELVGRGHLELDGRPVDSPETRVRAGNRVVHVMPDTVEPSVATNIRVLVDDDDVLVIGKPAPLPVHPCGRYNRHSLTALLEHCFPGEVFLPVHRLDADTTGIVVFARSSAAARHLARQFEARTVDKDYLALVAGRVTDDTFACDSAITSAPAGQGKRRLARDGHDAATRFVVCERFEQTTLLSAHPASGRTNQIRVHLASVGYPIVGDRAYAKDDPLISGREKLYLHAWRLTFCHPRTNERVCLEDERPSWSLELATPATPRPDVAGHESQPIRPAGPVRGDPL